MYRTREDLTGKKFGKWLVLEDKVSKRSSNRKCLCECGKVRLVNGWALKTGRSTQCKSCALRVTKKRHGMTGTPEYLAWCNAKDRCTRARSTFFKHYGARGIKMCERWLNSFENFYADMGPKPGPSYSLDRVDVNGGYSPENCRWATESEQQSNKRPHRYSGGAWYVPRDFSGELDGGRIKVLYPATGVDATDGNAGST